ncbi:MAG: hypothetical protein IT160_19815 [Bryobacterales bacterium]|nr:hypothetical protein [Bryobacterales bacterium]
MRPGVLILLAVIHGLFGQQTPDSAGAGKGEEETKFTAARLSAIAGAGRRAFLDRFEGKTLDILGAAGTRSIVDGVATLEIGSAEGNSRYRVVCRATDHASLQAAAVISTNQEVRVSGSVSLDGFSGNTILVSPCTILTNNVEISPTAELSESYARKQAKGGPPEGRYRCDDEDANIFAGWLRILPGNRYAQPTGQPGRYRWDEKLSRVFFLGGDFSGWQAEFHISSKGRILTLLNPEGSRRQCRWLGSQQVVR